MIYSFTGTGTLSTWLTPDNLNSNSIAQAIKDLGWGVVSCIVTKQPSTFDIIATGIFSTYLTYDYGFGISISGADGDNPERIRQALTAILEQWFINVSLVYTNTGGQPIQYTPASKQINDLVTNLGDTAKTILPTVNYTMIGIAVIGVLVLGSVLSSDRGRQYIKRYY